MNVIRFAAPALVLALAASAVHADDKRAHGLARLYQAAEVRDDDARKALQASPATATGHIAAASAPVHAVMRVKRLADGSYGVVCQTEAVPAGGSGPVLGGGHRRQGK